MAMNIAFCFVEGEPALFIRNTSKYHILCYDYDEILEIVESEIIKSEFKTRPQFITIWKILSNQFNCSEGYNPGLSKKTSLNENSFESRFSRDVTNFLDNFFKRGLTPEEKRIREEEKKWLKEQNEISETRIKQSIAIQKRRKRSGKVFFA